MVSGLSAYASPARSGWLPAPVLSERDGVAVLSMMAAGLKSRREQGRRVVARSGAEALLQLAVGNRAVEEAERSVVE